VAGAKAIVDHGGRVTDLADRFSVTTDTVQALDFAATQTGTNVETALTGIKKASIAATDALGGNDDKLAAFERLGITAKQLRELSPEQLFMQLADNLRTMPMTAQTFSDINDTLGRSGQELIPMFQQGLGDLMREARALGAVMDEETISRLDEAGDSMSAAAMQAKAAFAPLVSLIMDGISAILRGLNLISDFWGNRLSHVFAAAGLALSGNFIEAAKEGRKFLSVGGIIEDVSATAAKAAEDDALREAKRENAGKNKNARRQANMRAGFDEESDGKKAAERAAIKEASELERLQKQIEDRRIARLPEEQRLVQLKKELADAQKHESDTNHDGSVENLRAQLRVSELTDKIAQMEKKGGDRFLKEDSRLDSIQQIGGRLGENAAIQTGQKQLKTLEDMLAELRTGNTNTAVLKP
jgi:hypothetical protein